MNPHSSKESCGEFKVSVLGNTDDDEVGRLVLLESGDEKACARRSKSDLRDEFKFETFEQLLKATVLKPAMPTKTVT